MKIKHINKFHTCLILLLMNIMQLKNSNTTNDSPVPSLPTVTKPRV